MATNFMPELDQTNVLLKLLDNPKHIKRISDVNPHTDYSNWNDKLTTIKLMNVKWDAKNHVVNWKSEETRDNWFDAQKEGVFEYQTQWNVLDLENFAPSLGTYEGDIQVPLPLEQALGYNYIMVDRYQQPVKNDPNSVVRSRFFFFITGVNKTPRSPDNTDLIIELDAWTEYTFEGFESMAGDLERGHWAIDKITTQDYLNDPLDSPINLFEDEPTLPHLKPKVSYEKFTTPYNDPVIIIASTMDFKNDTGYLDNGNHTPTEDYWWLDYQNDNLSNKYKVDSDLDMSYLATVNPTYTDDGFNYDVDGGKPLGRATRKSINDNDQNITSTFYYILELDQWEPFITMLRRRYPQVYDTLTAVFILPRNYVLQGDKFTSTFGINMQYAHQQNALHDEADIKITTDMFNFKQDFTKLYTQQFAQLEISNLNGEVTKLNIEDTSGTLQMLFRANLMFPFLKFEGFINGKGGSVANTYTLQPLHKQDYQLFNSNWEQLHFEWDIPTYGIYEDAKTYSFQLGQKLQREWALNKLNYQQQLADIDKTHANTFNDIETVYKTGTNSANTAKDNSNRSNDTTLANALLSAETAKDNALRSINNTKQTADESNDTDLTTSLNSINTSYDIGQRDAGNNANNADAGITNTQSQWKANDTQLGAMSNLTLGANAAGAGAGIFFTMQKDGDINGTPNGGAGDAISLVDKGFLAGLDAIVTATKTQINSNQMKQSRDATEQQQTTVKDNNFSTQNADNTDQKNVDTTNANLSHDTTAEINAQNQATGTANTNETYNTTVTNANRSHDTTASNIAETYATTITNLNLNLNKGLTNLANEIKTLQNDAKIAYEKQKTEMDLTLAETISSSPKAVTENTGNGSIDAWGRRGIDVRVNRVTKADEDIIINEFKRFGYTMPANTWLQAPTFDPINSSYGSRNYSYWKFRDIYSWSTRMSETARSVIISILLDGVTIWNEPDNVQQGFLQ